MFNTVNLSIIQSFNRYWEEFLAGGWLNLLLTVAVLLLIFFLRNKVADLLLNLVLLKQKKTSPERAADAKALLLKPLGWLVFFIVTTAILPFFGLSPQAFTFFMKVLNSVMVIVASRILYLAVRHFFTRVEKETDLVSNSSEKTAFRYLGGAIGVVIVVLAVIIVLNQWVSNLGGVFATLGITGVALALAAQDTASNLVAGLAIMLDKPFDIGDWIETEASSGKIEGTVTEIGLRSSRVRALDGSLLTVPNSLMGSAVIVNGTKRGKRMYNQTLLLSPANSAEKLEAFRAGLFDLMEKDEGVIKGTAVVWFGGFERGALNWTLRFDTTADFDTHFQIKHRINMQVLELAEMRGIEWAKGFVPGN